MAITGQFGPVHIFHPSLTSLLLSWFCAKRVEIPWLHVEKVWNVGCAPAVLTSLASQLQGKGRKATLTRRINARLRETGLPLVCGFTCRVPRSSMLPAVRFALQKGVAAYERWNHDEKKWVLSRVKLVACRLEKHRDKWNAVQASKSVRSDHVDTADSTHVLSQVHGMRRIDSVWDVPVRPGLEEDLSKASACVACACCSLGIGGHARIVAVSTVQSCLPRSPLFRAERGMFRRTHACYQEYTSDMFRLENECIVPDDKRKKSMWKVPTKIYQLLLYHFALVSSTWQRASLSVQDADEWCRNCLQILLPHSLKKFLGFHLYSTITVVPYFYGTVKSKCFSPDGHTCKKPGHSCLRKVVSFSAWPRRKRWRFLHRALESVLKFTGMGDEVWSLKDACSVVDDRMSHVVGHACDFCDRCDARKPGLVLLTADAGQFFEVVKPHEAISSARRVFEKCSRMSGKTCATVLRGARRAAFVGGSYTQRPDRFVFSFSELLLAFAACLLMSFCTLGDMVWKMTGLPIGGVVSKVATSFVLAVQEHDWAMNIARRRGHGFSRRVHAWDFEVARARYVDDILWVSGRYCHACLSDAVSLAYSVPFDIDACAASVTWLDMELRLPDLTWRMKPTLWTLPPPWGAPKGYAHSFLCGRFQRWSEVRLCDDAWLTAATNLLLSFRDAGWPESAIRAAIFKAGKLKRYRRDMVLKVLRVSFLH